MKDKVIVCLNEEELNDCTAFLQELRARKKREEKIKQLKERIRNDIKELYEFITPIDYELAIFLEDIVRKDLDLDYEWELV